MLAIELLDELVFGVREAAWPLIRANFGLSYGDVGLLLTIPITAATFIEPALGVLADAGHRRSIVAAGGLAFAGALCIAGVAWGFLPLMMAFLVLAPASGAFVSLSQTTLMDLAPQRHEANMIRWTIAGYVGVVLGPLALAGAVALGLGWRPLMLLLAAATLPLCLWSRSTPQSSAEPASFRAALRSARSAARQLPVLRWLVVLQLTDLLGDVLLGYLALYFVDVARAQPLQATLAVGLWSAAGLAGEVLLLPLIERTSGVLYLRVSAAVATVVFPAFLLAPGIAPKLVLVTLLGLLHAGWYAIPTGRLYSELPASSGAVLALENVAGLFGHLAPLGVGLLAERLGLATAMWPLLLAPAGLLAGLVGVPARPPADSPGTGDD